MAAPDWMNAIRWEPTDPNDLSPRRERLSGLDAILWMAFVLVVSFALILVVIGLLLAALFGERAELP